MKHFAEELKVSLAEGMMWNIAKKKISRLKIGGKRAADLIGYDDEGDEWVDLEFPAWTADDVVKFFKKDDDLMFGSVKKSGDMAILRVGYDV